MFVFFKFISTVTLVLTISLSVNAQNVKFNTYQVSKYKMYDIYRGHNETFYCKATFDNQRNIILPEGMSVPKQYKNKGKDKMEWEHIVPAENFGRTFDEWNKQLCDTKTNRECVQRLSPEFNRMEADMYNLYPSIGFVNTMRSNYNFTELPKEVPNSVAGCNFKVYKRKVEPAEYTKGVIARTYFYMEDAYPRYKISKKMKKMLVVWDKEHPVDEWECKRAKRIEKVQGNPNKFVKEPCIEKGLW